MSIKPYFIRDERNHTTIRKPRLRWNNDGQAFELSGSFYDCPNKDEDLRDTDSYGELSYRCTYCDGYGSHQRIYTESMTRRPEFDAPTPKEWDES